MKSFKFILFLSFAQAVISVNENPSVCNETDKKVVAVAVRTYNLDEFVQQHHFKTKEIISCQAFNSKNTRSVIASVVLDDKECEFEFEFIPTTLIEFVQILNGDSIDFSNCKPIKKQVEEVLPTQEIITEEETIPEKKVEEVLPTQKIITEEETIPEKEVEEVLSSEKDIPYGGSEPFEYIPENTLPPTNTLDEETSPKKEVDEVLPADDIMNKLKLLNTETNKIIADFENKEDILEDEEPVKRIEELELISPAKVQKKYDLFEADKYNMVAETEEGRQILEDLENLSKITEEKKVQRTPAKEHKKNALFATDRYNLTAETEEGRQALEDLENLSKITEEKKVQRTPAKKNRKHDLFATDKYNLTAETEEGRQALEDLENLSKITEEKKIQRTPAKKNRKHDLFATDKYNLAAETEEGRQALEDLENLSKITEKKEENEEESQQSPALESKNHDSYKADEFLMSAATEQGRQAIEDLIRLSNLPEKTTIDQAIKTVTLELVDIMKAVMGNKDNTQEKKIELEQKEAELNDMAELLELPKLERKDANPRRPIKEEKVDFEKTVAEIDEDTDMPEPPKLIRQDGHIGEAEEDENKTEFDEEFDMPEPPKLIRQNGHIEEAEEDENKTEFDEEFDMPEPPKLIRQDGHIEEADEEKEEIKLQENLENKISAIVNELTNISKKIHDNQEPLEEKKEALQDLQNLEAIVKVNKIDQPEEEEKGNKIFHEITTLITPKQQQDSDLNETEAQSSSEKKYEGIIFHEISTFTGPKELMKTLFTSENGLDEKPALERALGGRNACPESKLKNLIDTTIENLAVEKNTLLSSNVISCTQQIVNGIKYSLTIGESPEKSCKVSMWYPASRSGYLSFSIIKADCVKNYGKNLGANTKVEVCNQEQEITALGFFKLNLAKNGEVTSYHEKIDSCKINSGNGVRYDLELKLNEKPCHYSEFSNAKGWNYVVENTCN